MLTWETGLLTKVRSHESTRLQITNGPTAVEQYKNVDNIVACIQEVDQKTGLPLCNSRCCPVMSAGRYIFDLPPYILLQSTHESVSNRSHTYTWLNHAKEPVKVPAQQYISLVQRWIVGKLSDNKTFPTDPLTNASSSFPITSPSPSTAMSPIPTGPTSLTAPLSELSGHDWVGKATGFPENFFTDCKTIFRQIFRVYAHVYHSHWVDPFWHIHNSNPPSSGWTDLNSCFVHFVTVAKLFGLLTEKDLEPMQPLVDIWIANGSIPPDAANGVCAVVPGHY